MRRAALFLGVVVALLPAMDAFADASAEDKAAADKLFNDGLKLAKANNFAEACPKFEASQSLDPAIGTLLNLGICYERIGRYASAWSSYNSCAGMASLKKDPREEQARQAAQDLEPKLSMFTIEVEKGADDPALTVRRDGKTVARDLWGVAVPVDPGDHVIEASIPGHEPWKTTVKVDKPGPASVQIPKLVLSKPKGVASPPPAAGPYVPFWGVQRIVAVNAVGLGFVGMGLGAGFGVDALGKTSAAKDHCFGGTPLRCDAEGQSLYSGARTSALTSDIGLIAGGVLLAGGAALWLTSPPGSGAPPKDTTKPGVIALTPGIGGVSLHGRW